MATNPSRCLLTVAVICLAMGNRVIAEQTSGTKYWFRVRAIGGNDQTSWSDPATKVAP
jgi:hypothetical protein